MDPNPYHFPVCELDVEFLRAYIREPGVLVRLVWEPKLAATNSTVKPTAVTIEGHSPEQKEFCKRMLEKDRSRRARAKAIGNIPVLARESTVQARGTSPLHEEPPPADDRDDRGFGGRPWLGRHIY